MTPHREQARLPEAVSTIARLTAVIDFAPTAMVMIDREGWIVLANREAARLFGYEPGELLGQPVERLVPGEFRRRHPGLRASYFDDPTPRRMGAGRELFGLRKDGSRFPVEIGLNPIETEEGAFVLSAIVDISARKQLEARFRAAVESAPTAMVMTDAAGRIVLVNGETEKLFGYRREELLGREVEALVPQRFRPQHPGLRSHFYHRPEARRMGAGRDLFALRKDGSEFPVEIGLNPIEAEEGVLVLSVIVDITERKALEAALRQANEQLELRVAQRTEQLAQYASELKRANEALERSNLELQQFAYVASHDLQSPLRSISGFVQLLQSEYAGHLDARADDWIRRTVEAIQRMQTLIRDVLSVSRVESRARPFRPTALGELVSEALVSLEPSIRESGAEIRCDELPTVMGDPSQLAQLMHNLIGNALTYHGDGPPRIHISASKREGAWQFSVRDDGIGIDPRYHDQIFEMFRRLHGPKEYPGTGIGLAVCRRVVHRHGGRIWVESRPGAGSAFHFTIPEGAEETR